MTENRKYAIIAVDFDGTLCRDCYPNIGEPNLPLLYYLREQKKQGTKLILWTCRSSLPLAQAVAWCESLGLTFDSVNQNLPENIAQYGTDTRKVYADLYIDDRSINWSFQTESGWRIQEA
ncbi:hypothetical protein SAMN02910358_02084 [Lachnospiraceae bacterium XBB1006]|nr:hypothetical protein SAMN02910358_02084 [Lachnospiraceae bacterium XBB1006]